MGVGKLITLQRAFSNISVFGVGSKDKHSPYTNGQASPKTKHSATLVYPPNLVISADRSDTSPSFTSWIRLRCWISTLPSCVFYGASTGFNTGTQWVVYRMRQQCARMGAQCLVNIVGSVSFRHQQKVKTVSVFSFKYKRWWFIMINLYFYTSTTLWFNDLLVKNIEWE